MVDVVDNVVRIVWVSKVGRLLAEREQGKKEQAL
jgi:hypothetical protein